RGWRPPRRHGHTTSASQIDDRCERGCCGGQGFGQGFEGAQTLGAAPRGDRVEPPRRTHVLGTAGLRGVSGQHPQPRLRQRRDRNRARCRPRRPAHPQVRRRRTARLHRLPGRHRGAQPVNLGAATISGSPQLPRRLGTLDAVTIGLGAMIGAGIFVALGPAAAAAGPWLLAGLGIAAAVAYCNATASARLAARYPQSGGTYVHGRERLGAFWGYTAGFSFVVGKTASCAAMALTIGFYLWPGHAHAIAVAAVVALTALTYLGIEKSALLTRLVVAGVLGVLTAVVVLVLGF